MELNIYENKKIVKTYTADSYDLPFGIVEDVAEAVNLDSLKTGDDIELFKMVGALVLQSMDTIKTLLKDVFEGITEEEIRKARVTEIAQCIVDIVKYTIAQLELSTRSKK